MSDFIDYKKMVIENNCYLLYFKNKKLAAKID